MRAKTKATGLPSDESENGSESEEENETPNSGHEEKEGAGDDGHEEEGGEDDREGHQDDSTLSTPSTS